MLDLKQFSSAIKQIAEEKGISEVKIIETIEHAIAAAYKKDYGKKGQIVRAKLDDSGAVKIWQLKYVIEGIDEEGYVTGSVLKGHLLEEEKESLSSSNKKKKESLEDEEGAIRDESGEIKIKYSPEKHILLEEAQKENPKVKIGDEIIIPLETHTDFGRIAAQTAKQVIIQRLREAERDSIFDEFKSREGEIISALVQRREGKTLYMDIGRTTGILPPGEQLYSDNYRIGARFRTLIYKVEETGRGPVILLSRSHPDLVKKLFESEVPEITAGAVEIKAVSREPGLRSKVAVVSHQDGVDPIGSLVGQKGIRVQTVINELSGEKIDIIEWSEDPLKFIANAMSPAKIMDVKMLDKEAKHVLVEVADDQFSLAIGKRGQNVRLAAKLGGWKIDVRSPKEELKAEQLDQTQEPSFAKASEGKEENELQDTKKE